jgi:cell division protein FtsB
MAAPNIKRLDWTVTLSCLTLLGYFAWQAVLSPNGFSFLEKQRQALLARQQVAATLRHQRTTLEGRVVLVRRESLDPDMLDELARTQLGWVAKNDIVVALKSQNP